MSLFAELKRRNVFRVAVAAAVTAWLVTEVASVVLPTFGAPDWVLKALITLLMIGFPIALIFAWVYEITPEGVKLEREIDRSRSITSHTGRRLDVITIALVVLGVGFVMLERFVWTGDPQLAVESALESEAVSDRSIAVLARNTDPAASPRPSGPRPPRRSSTGVLAAAPATNRSGELQ